MSRSRPAPPTAPASSPARWGSTPARWSRSCATAPHRARRAGGAGHGQALGRGRGRLTRRPAPRRPAGAADEAWPGAAAAPAPGKLPATLREGAAAVYVPSCTNRIFGGSPVTALVEVSRRAGRPVWIPDEVGGQLLRAALELERIRRGPPPQGQRDGRGPLGLERGGGAADRDRRRLLHPRRSPTRATGILSEANAERLGKLEILDSVAGRTIACWPRLRSAKRSARRPSIRPARPASLGLARRLESLAGVLAEDVYVAPSATCCGFAGDRGISHPELTEAATRDQAAELAGRRFDAHLSSNRTCEIGLERATGQPYESIVLLLERLTRA